jgi:hypothetical protein
MKYLVIPSVAVLIASIGMVAHSAELQSGLQVGESAGAFTVNDCTGPNEGKSLCYR